jgi:RHS repeat-associated protein
LGGARTQWFHGSELKLTTSRLLKTLGGLVLLASLVASSARADNPPPPQITITAPAGGLLTNATTVTVSGTAFASPGAEPVTLTIHSIPVAVNQDGTFTGTIVLNSSWNVVSVVRSPNRDGPLVRHPFLRGDAPRLPAVQLISNVLWEPYGGLRGYQITHPGSSTMSTVEYLLGDDGTKAPNACPSAAPDAAKSDHTGRLRGLWVSTGAQPAGSATGDIYTRTYTWQADQVVRTDSCTLGATAPHSETYSYDALLRLTSGARPTGGLMANVGGSFDSRSYGYDGRGNRTSQVNEDCPYTLTYGASGHPDRLTSRASACPGAMLSHAYAYDADGRVTSNTWAQPVGGSPPYAMVFAAGESDGSSNGALDSVLKSATVNGAVYNYFYDALNRRRIKVYPTGYTDEFFHSQSDQLIVDRGLSAVSTPTALPIDEYVWLGGRPVVLIRGQLSTSYARQSDATASCPRNGDAAACGFYFPITDHIGKPVLMLDAHRRVAGIGEYDPFGQLNRVTLDAESAHPYDPATMTTTTLADFTQPIGGTANPSTTVAMRVLFHLVGIETYVPGDAVPPSPSSVRLAATAVPVVPPGTVTTAELAVFTPGTTTPLWSTAANDASNIWTDWLAPSGGRLQVLFSTLGWPDCFGTPCTGTFSGDLTGAVMEGYEYRRYQTGAAWFWTPLRFPGQYYDPETDLVQNWNRFYDPISGRYCEAEPLLDQPKWVQSELRGGNGVSSYTYARGNPNAVTDAAGLAPSAPPQLLCWHKLPPGVIKYMNLELSYLCHGEILSICTPQNWEQLSKAEKCATCMADASGSWTADCRSQAEDVCKPFCAPAPVVCQAP